MNVPGFPASPSPRPQRQRVPLIGTEVCPWTTSQVHHSPAPENRIARSPLRRRGGHGPSEPVGGEADRTPRLCLATASQPMEPTRTPGPSRHAGDGEADLLGEPGRPGNLVASATPTGSEERPPAGLNRSGAPSDLRRPQPPQPSPQANQGTKGTHVRPASKRLNPRSLSPSRPGGDSDGGQLPRHDPPTSLHGTPGPSLTSYRSPGRPADPTTGEGGSAMRADPTHTMDSECRPTPMPAMMTGAPPTREGRRSPPTSGTCTGR